MDTRLERWGIKNRGEGEEMRDGNRDGESRRWELGVGECEIEDGVERVQDTGK